MWIAAAVIAGALAAMISQRAGMRGSLLVTVLATAIALLGAVARLDPYTLISVAFGMLVGAVSRGHAALARDPHQQPGPPPGVTP